MWYTSHLNLNLESNLTLSVTSKLFYYQLLLPTFINYFIYFNMVSSTENFPIKSSIKTTNSIIKRSLSTRVFVPRNRFERLTHSLEGCCSIQLSYRGKFYSLTWQLLYNISRKINLRRLTYIIPFPNWEMNKPAVNFTILEHIATFCLQSNELT